MQKKILLAGLLLLALMLTFFIGMKWNARKYSTYSVAKQNSSSVYASYEGGQVLEAEVLAQIKNDLATIDRNAYQLKRRIVEDIILQRTGNLKGSSTTLTLTQTAESDPEYQKFLVRRGLDLKKMKPLERKNVLQNYRFSEADQTRKESRKAALEATHIKWKIPITFYDQLVQIETGFLRPLGPSSAKVQVIIFANYQCPYCAEAFRKIDQLRTEHSEDLQIHFRYSFGDPENSFVAQSALAGACANDQNKFWEYSKALINKNPANELDLIALADDQQMDSKKFSDCLKSKKFWAAISKDREQAEALRMERSPIFIINGHLFPVQEPIENLEIVLSQFL